MVLTDETCRVPSVYAKDAVKTEEQLLEWSSQPEDNRVFEPFPVSLLKSWIVVSELNAVIWSK